jgi:hypothetical protein
MERLSDVLLDQHFTSLRRDRKLCASKEFLIAAEILFTTSYTSAS